MAGKLAEGVAVVVGSVLLAACANGGSTDTADTAIFTTTEAKMTTTASATITAPPTTTTTTSTTTPTTTTTKLPTAEVAFSELAREWSLTEERLAADNNRMQRLCGPNSDLDGFAQREGLSAAVTRVEECVDLNQGMIDEIERWRVKVEDFVADFPDHSRGAEMLEITDTTYTNMTDNHEDILGTLSALQAMEETTPNTTIQVTADGLNECLDGVLADLGLTEDFKQVGEPNWRFPMALRNNCSDAVFQATLTVFSQTMFENGVSDGECEFLNDIYYETPSGSRAEDLVLDALLDC